MKTWSYPGVHPEGDGPWADEPDKAQWVDETTGLDCLAVRAHHGAWCGYVGIPPGHPWYDANPYHLGYECEAGIPELNYGDRCRDDDPEPAVCHVPAPGRPADVYWVGFDNAHAWDLAPNRDREIRAITGEATTAYDNLLTSMSATYKTLDYVVDQCRRVAAQAALAAT